MPKSSGSNVIRVNDVKNSALRKRMLKWFEGGSPKAPSLKKDATQREI